MPISPAPLRPLLLITTLCGSALSARAASLPVDAAARAGAEPARVPPPADSEMPAGPLTLGEAVLIASRHHGE